MTKQLSFVKYENEVLPDYRNKLNNAESTEDVRKFFGYTVRELFRLAMNGEEIIDEEDIILAEDEADGYSVSESAMKNEKFTAMWEDSDLGRVIKDLALQAQGRMKRLEKHPEKTDAKIRQM